MALILLKSLKCSTSRTFILVNNQEFCKVIRFSYQSVTGQLHANLVKRWKLVADLLDIPEDTSRRIVLKTKGVQSMSVNNLERIADVFKEIQVVREKLIDFPEVLGHFPIQIEQRYYCLKELGLQPVNIPEISRYPTLIKKNAFDLKLMHLMPADVDPLDRLLSQLPFLRLDFLAKYPNIRNMSLSRIRKVVILEFLSQKLECRKSEVLQIMEKYPVLIHRSICFHLATIEMLMDTLEFSTNRLKLSKYLLTIQLSNVKKLLSNIPEFGGQCIKSFVQKHPRFLLISANQILKTYEHLKQLGLSDAQITNCWEIYTLPMETVQNLSNEISTTWSADKKSNPSILSYIYRLHMTRQKLQAQGLTHTSMEVLNIFDKDLMLKTLSIEDIYTSKENISYLAEQFNRDTNFIRKELVRHPRLYLFQMHDCRRILNYLIQEGFSKLQVENALHLVLYSIDTIKTNLAALPLHNDIEIFGDWKTHPYILQLILYEIEKNYLSTNKCDRGVRKAKLPAQEEPAIFQMAEQSKNRTILNFWEPDELALNNPENESFGNHTFWE